MSQKRIAERCRKHEIIGRSLFLHQKGECILQKNFRKRKFRKAF